MEYVNNWIPYFKECVEDLDIPKDWKDLSYHDDVCPSFEYKGFHIFVNHKDPKQRDGYEEEYDIGQRFYIHRIREYFDPKFEKSANTLDEVIQILDDVNTYHEVARHFMDKEDRTYKFETGKKLSLDDWIYKNGHALHKDDLQEAHDIIDLCGDA
tara:strand:- start:2618 stop:3082 length:465 start_codon:yes stop_codon:yes gene_type:complete